MTAFGLLLIAYLPLELILFEFLIHVFCPFFLLGYQSFIDLKQLLDIFKKLLALDIANIFI